MVRQTEAARRLAARQNPIYPPFRADGAASIETKVSERALIFPTKLTPFSPYKKFNNPHNSMAAIALAFRVSPHHHYMLLKKTWTVRFSVAFCLRWFPRINKRAWSPLPSVLRTCVFTTPLPTAHALLSTLQNAAVKPRSASLRRGAVCSSRSPILTPGCSRIVRKLRSVIAYHSHGVS